eukprot:TRINITY_DN12451_c0_g1::TRINITY_DN12451_c0_g1_i1::g.15092::m.15092 TRINITY_DN12451_c0_g1::TRINITY_DN12451_c0_g1_i1::g.15092  ORF type:complete len:540 (+),score=89.45,sp/A8MQ27/NEU1B_HUMAN/52.46/3e-12,zf-C3HC4_3/PF13920.1/4e-13,zf-C3HC4_2/PF13923.1/3.7e-05,zf-RING_2/PF13639.1/0.17 TRINITY_DN12451_c0_g1_i1:50-1669(+)
MENCVTTESTNTTARNSIDFVSKLQQVNELHAVRHLKKVSSVDTSTVNRLESALRVRVSFSESGGFSLNIEGIPRTNNEQGSSSTHENRVTGETRRQPRRNTTQVFADLMTQIESRRQTLPGSDETSSESDDNDALPRREIASLAGRRLVTAVDSTFRSRLESIVALAPRHLVHPSRTRSTRRHTVQSNTPTTNRSQTQARSVPPSNNRTAQPQAATIHENNGAEEVLRPRDAREDVEAEIQELTGRGRVRGFLRSSFRDRLERFLRNHIRNRRMGNDPGQVGGYAGLDADTLMQRRNNPALHNISDEESRVGWNVDLNPDEEMEMILNDGAAPHITRTQRANPSTQSDPQLHRTINTLQQTLFAMQAEMTEMRRMMHASFEITMELQRTVRQDIASAFAPNNPQSNNTTPHPNTHTANPHTHIQPAQAQGMILPAATPATLTTTQIHRHESTTTVTTTQTPSASSLLPATASSASPSPTPINTGTCIVCCDRSADTVFYRCGHVCTCSSCGYGLLLSSRPQCPICRAAISDVLRIYVP